MQIVTRAALLALAWLSAGLLDSPQHAGGRAGGVRRRHPSGRHRPPPWHDRPEDLRPVPRTHQSLGRGRPLRRADPRRRLRGQRLRDVLDSLRAAGRGARRGDVRSSVARRACGSPPARQPAGIRQERVFLESGRSYDGSVWIKIESGAPRLSLRVLAKDGSVLADRSAAGARIGVAGSAVLVRECAHRSRRGRRDRGRSDAARRSSISCR